MRQIAEPDVVFRIFGLIVLVPLAVLGFATFERTLQLALEDVGYARRINRLRRFYFRSGIDLADYLVPPIGEDDRVAIMQQAGVHLHHRWQPFLTTAGMIGVINCFLVGVVAGFTAEMAGGGVLFAVPLGAVLFALAVVLQYRHATHSWRHLAATRI
jgi:hypothetical protein